MTYIPNVWSSVVSPSLTCSVSIVSGSLSTGYARNLPKNDDIPNSKTSKGVGQSEIYMERERERQSGRQTASAYLHQYVFLTTGLAVCLSASIGLSILLSKWTCFCLSVRLVVCYVVCLYVSICFDLIVCPSCCLTVYLQI